MLTQNAMPGATRLRGNPTGIGNRVTDAGPVDAERPQQTALDEVGRAWEALPASLFGGEDERVRARDAFVRVGLFHAFTGARRAGQSVDACAALALSAPEVRALRGHRSIVQAWIAPLRPASPRRATHPAEERDEPLSEPHPEARTVDFERVCAQQEAIIDALRKRNPARARAMIEDLCAYQANSKPIYLAKSLCALAAQAHRLGLGALQEELTERATRVCPEDPWSWSQRGAALRAAGDPAGALHAYARALALGDPVSAHNGRADVLKDLGRFDDALQLFEETLRAHPDSVFARHGRADVLRTMGRLCDALDAYDAMLLDDPTDVFAKTGRAMVFKTGRRFEEALAAYADTAREHPECIVAKTGGADVLKVMGRLADALSAYDAALLAHPASMVARTGRADILRLLGRHDDSLAAYHEAGRAHPQDAAGTRGRAASQRRAQRRGATG